MADVDTNKLVEIVNGVVGRVSDMHTAFGLTKNSTLTILPKEETLMRVNIILEEVNETISALMKFDKREFVDGLCDIIVTATGYFIASGAHQSKFPITESSEAATGLTEAILYKMESDYMAFTEILENLVSMRAQILDRIDELESDDIVSYSYVSGANDPTAFFTHALCLMVASAIHFDDYNILENFNIVMDSNMSKICPTIEDAEQTKNHYAAQGIDTYIRPCGLNDGRFIVFRQDGKFLKFIGWNTPNIILN